MGQPGERGGPVARHHCVEDRLVLRLAGGLPADRLGELMDAT